jgi:hypothetical protein
MEDNTESMVIEYGCKAEYTKIIECLGTNKDKISKCDVLKK